MKILVVAGPVDFDISSQTLDPIDRYVGVDRGALWILENGYPLDLAVGDFDSVNEEEERQIEEASAHLIRLPREKDLTDLEEALTQANSQYPQAQFLILGGIGGRLDHTLLNIFLPTRPHFTDLLERIRWMDGQNLVDYLSAGRHKIQAEPGYKYLGFVQIDTGRSLEIAGAKYPLRAKDNFSDIYTSNEFLEEDISVAFKQGTLLVIHSRDLS